MHEIGGKAGAARGTSTPTTQAAKVRPALALDIKGNYSSAITHGSIVPFSTEVIQIDGR
jgi:hypothetical protein